MRYFLVLSLAIAALGACSQSDEQRLVADCRASGEQESTCLCIISAMQTRLSPELYTLTAASVGRLNKDMVDFAEGLSLEQQVEFSRFAEGYQQCNLAKQAQSETAEPDANTGNRVPTAPEPN
jgi:hypothetical protein